MTGVVDPATGRREDDKIGLTCAACHTGQIHYKGVAVRFDGGPAMTDLKKLELATGLSIAYTLNVPFRFRRFADRVLGPDASDADRDALKQKLGAIGKFLLDWQNTYDKTIAGKKTAQDEQQQQKDTEEGFGRLDALNRIGNQVFSQDFALSGVGGFEKNLHAQDAPVSFPPIWTVPWLKYAQYDASIEQPLIRNAGEALGVTALLNLSSDYPADTLFRSSVDHRQSALDRDDAARPRSLRPESKAVWRTDGRRNGRRRFSVTIRHGRSIPSASTMAASSTPRSAPSATSARSMIRNSTRNFRKQSFWSSDHWEHSGKDRCSTRCRRRQRKWERTPRRPTCWRSEPFRCPVPRHAARARPRKMVGVSRPASHLFNGNAVLARADGDGGPRQPEMDGRSAFSIEEREKLWGATQELPQPRAEGPRYRARPAERRLGHRALSSQRLRPLALLAAHARGRASEEFCMGGARDFDPEHVGLRVDRR